MSKEFQTTIRNCARCLGGNHAVTMRPFRRRAGRHTHWAICPTTNEPILTIQFESEVSEKVHQLFDKIRNLESELMDLVGIYAPPADALPNSYDIPTEANATP